jgi:hypothetical protein
VDWNSTVEPDDSETELTLAMVFHGLDELVPALESLSELET